MACLRNQAYNIEDETARNSECGTAHTCRQTQHIQRDAIFHERHLSSVDVMYVPAQIPSGQQIIDVALDPHIKYS